MASDAAAWRKDPRMIFSALWIGGCATYYYVRFTWIIAGERGDALRELAGALADAFALSGAGR